LKVAENILNKHSREAEKGWSPGEGGRGVQRKTNRKKKKKKVSQNEKENSDYEIEKDELHKECETFGEKLKHIQDFGGEF